ncbi:MAG: acetate--CoA ligase family protein [Candidatus Lokiarchaeota archaeon]|nr:acetate--CoA ligase family protein [Candidatus Lokiarchaeota archaeon]
MEHESKDLISKYGVPVGEYRIVKSKSEAIEYANNIGYPVVAKLMSPDIVHKTDAKVIRLNIESDDELSQAYDEVITNGKNYKLDAKVIGVNIQKMAKNGVAEIIIGGVRDKNFGPVLMFGFGGIFVEIFKDVSYRVCPLSKTEAERMIRSIKAFPLLDGYRGQFKGDIDQLTDIMLKCCNLLIENPEIMELDLNPVIVFEIGKGVTVVDARIILKEVN